MTRGRGLCRTALCSSALACTAILYEYCEPRGISISRQVVRNRVSSCPIDGRWTYQPGYRKLENPSVTKSWITWSDRAVEYQRAWAGIQRCSSLIYERCTSSLGGRLCVLQLGFLQRPAPDSSNVRLERCGPGAARRQSRRDLKRLGITRSTFGISLPDRKTMPRLLEFCLADLIGSCELRSLHPSPGHLGNGLNALQKIR